MTLKEMIKDKTCYIISSELKEEILSYLHDNKLLLDVHFFTLNEIIERIYFKYDDEAIFMVSKNFNLSFSNAKLMIDNLKYLMHSNKVENSKYDYLLEIKTYLDHNNLLSYDESFINYLNKYNIISDLNLSNEFLHRINQLLNNKINFIMMENKTNTHVYEFSDSEREIEYVANEISKLLIEGIPANNIHILNYNDAYSSYVSKIFTLYNIPYSLKNKNKLFHISYIKKLYKDYVEKDELNLNNDNSYITLNNQFISIINRVNFIENITEKHSYLLYLLENTNAKEKNYNNVVTISSYETFYLDNHYYFFIGLNNKVFPLYRKNEDYLDDNLKIKLGYLPSYKCNEINKKYCINRLLSNSNISISYRNSDYFNSYLKSDIVNDICKEVLHINNINQYSKEYDKLKFTKRLDEFYKYDSRSEELVDLLTKLNKSEYKSYDNSYTQVNKDSYHNNIKNNYLSISYSSFEKFNECSYKYYLDSILKEREDKFTTYLGSLFHHVLEKIYDNDFNFEESINSFTNDYILNDKEQILLSNLIDDFKNKIEIILEQYNKGNYKNIKKEQNISIKSKTNLSININGFIDKIMMDDNNHAYLVDYKTGDTNLTLNYLDYGLKCQLPFYFYLLNKSEDFANIFLVGCYLQIINFKIKTSDSSSKELLLEGLTYNDEEIINGIDNYYKEDSFIKGIKPNSKGLGTYARVFNNDDFKVIIDTMDKNICTMINDVNEVNFNINPKIIKKKETTCKFCNYKDICFHTFKDYIDIREVVNDEMDR